MVPVYCVDICETVAFAAIWSKSMIRWRPVLYFPDTEFCTFFSGHVPTSSDLHVVWTRIVTKTGHYFPKYLHDLWFHVIWVFCEKLSTWMASNNIDLWSTKYMYWPVFTLKSELNWSFMPPLLDVLCPYFCLNQMAINRKTYISMLSKGCIVHLTCLMWKRCWNDKILSISSASGRELLEYLECMQGWGQWFWVQPKAEVNFVLNGR